VVSHYWGRDKLDTSQLDKALNEHGRKGWELTQLKLDVNVKGQRDGALLVFRRPLGA
jgi:hypothetical protein